MLHRVPALAALLVAAFASASARGHEPSGATLQETVDARVDAALPDLVTAYKDLHSHPELSFQETRSAGLLADRLAELGFQVTREVGGTGIVGVLENGEGPVLLLRTDLDALPLQERTGVPWASQVVAHGPDGRETAVMHACGHDVHQTVLWGTARVLAQLRDSWSGTVVAIGQPAEEIGKGAAAMLADGLFTRFPKPDCCLALHVTGDLAAGSVGIRPGFALANVDSVDITIHGRGGHGSRPQTAVDPIVCAAHLVLALQTIVSRRNDPLEPAVISVGSIHAGTKHNIIPDEAKLQLTVRSYSEETRKLLLDSIRQISADTCKTFGCPRAPDVEFSEPVSATYNDPALAERARAVFEGVVGADRVLERAPVMGAEDFGAYPRTAEVPGLLFWLGSASDAAIRAAQEPGADPLPSTHSPLYAPDPEPTIRTGVRTLSALALDVLRRDAR